MDWAGNLLKRKKNKWINKLKCAGMAGRRGGVHEKKMGSNVQNAQKNKVLNNEWILKCNSPWQKLSESNIPVIQSACDAAN